jgi:hypothetical protein
MTIEKDTELIERLRALRRQARDLRATLVDDLRSFQKEDGSFYTLPDSDRVGVSIASSCTALMALADADKLDDLKPIRVEKNGHAASLEQTESARNNVDNASGAGRNNNVKPKESAAVVLPQTAANSTANGKETAPDWSVELFAKVVESGWKTSGLDDLNAFSTCMVIRAAGFMVSAGKLKTPNVEALPHVAEAPEKAGVVPVADALGENRKPSLSQIALGMASGAPETFKVHKYPSKTTMAYWFVDGISKSGIDITAHWGRIADWAVREFQRQLSYVVSGNDARMDPAELAMAACLISRIGRFCSRSANLSKVSEALPSRVELRDAVSRVFGEQADSGIWHKYFPLFHFPGSGAADYCFSFEFLEALLIEFSEDNIVVNPEIVDGLTEAVRWCDINRLEFRTHSGWNAGGDVAKLTAGMPEAWATASVHMFLWELDSSLSMALQKLILDRFARVESPSSQKWEDLIDVEIKVPGEDTTLKIVTDRELITPALNKSEQTLRKRCLKGRRSALLFGPPGTSKTSFAKALAGRLKWPLIVITPSEFLSEGLEQIHVRATEIFQDLIDLAGVVVFFDEMDALAQTRGNPTLDVTRQLLTTSMLPKLTDLYDQANVIFLMATNHKKDLDPAIIRPARFDLLLCVGPPSWVDKLAGLKQVLKDLPSGDIDRVRIRLEEFSNSLAVRQQLDVFTVGDLRSFFESIRRKEKKATLLEALNDLTSDSFQADVATWHKNYITLAIPEKKPNEEMDLITEYGNDRQASRIQ